MSDYRGILFSSTVRGAVQRPLGPHRIASFLRENGWDVEVVDFLQYWTLDELKKLVISRSPEKLKFIGFSYQFMYDSYFPVDLCLWIREKYPHIKILSGGQFIFPEAVHHCDYIIQGYAEYSILELFKYLFSNGTRPTFTNFSSKAKIVDGSQRYSCEKPLKSLMTKYEKRDFLKPYNVLGLEFSRGCKFSCLYCNYPILGVKEDTSRDADDFENQVKDAYYNYGVNSYIVVDETFNDYTGKITKFANVVEKLDFELEFIRTFIRADLLISRPQDQYELLRMNNFRHFYGVETFNHASGKLIGKGMHPDKMKSGLLDIKNFYRKNGKDYYSMLALIFGLPHETLTSSEETISWVENNWSDQYILGNYLRIPKSEFEKSSSFSLEYSKYGYEEMSEEEIFMKKQLLNFIDISVIAGGNVDTIIQDSNLYMMWKNEHMDIFDALYFMNRITQSVGENTLHEKEFHKHNDFLIKQQIDKCGMGVIEYYKYEKLNYLCNH